MYYPGVKYISDKEALLAIIIYDTLNEEGVHFLTDHHLSQQLAYMKHPSGKVIKPHFHNPVPRNVQFTQEVLFIKKGKLRVDFYSSNQEYIESYILKEGNVILLIGGGHGFEVIEDIEMFEVKQGPYAGDRDKTLFEPCPNERIVMKS